MADTSASPTTTELAGPRRRTPWLREVVIVHAFYWTYQSIRRAAGSGTTTRANANANRLIGWEQSLHMYNEQAIQSFFLGSHAFIKLFNIYYGTLHFIITAGLLVWLFLRHHDGYRQMRNILGTATGLALVGYWGFPLTPPRLIPCNNDIVVYGPDSANIGGCFVDTLDRIGGLWSYESPVATAIANNFAAMPSLHFGWSLWCGMVFYRFLKNRAGRILAFAYPALTLFAIVITGNHYWLDAAGGAVVVLAALGVQRLVRNWQARRGLRRVPAAA